MTKTDIIGHVRGDGTVKGLKAAYFRRIYIGLMLDLIIMIASPLTVIITSALLTRQMTEAGIKIMEISADTVLNYPSLLSRLLYALLVLRYCLAALSAMIVISGMGELRECSPSFRRSCKYFVALMIMNAVVMVTRVAYIMVAHTETSMWAGTVNAVAEFSLIVTRGMALFLLLRGYEDVMNSIGAFTESQKTHSLASFTVVSFAVYGMTRMLDHFAPPMTAEVSMTLFAAEALVMIIAMIIHIRVIKCSRNMYGIIAEISDEAA